jgi:hypothetical protein
MPTRVIQVTPFPTENWTITPVEKPTGTRESSWLMVLSGVGIVTLQGNVPNDYLRETLLIAPDIDSPMQYALAKYSAPQGLHPLHEPAGRLAFLVDQWAPFAAISSFYDAETGSSVHVGFAVDNWRLHGSNAASQPFSGIEVDIALLNKTVLYRVSYQITLVGRIVHEPLTATQG